MSANTIGFHQYEGNLQIKDPGASGSITVDRSPAVVALVSTGAEARTLNRPHTLNEKVKIYCKTYGGTITLTVTGGFNVTGDTTFAFTAAGQFAIFESAYNGTSYYWRLTSHYALGNASPTEAAALDGLLATAAQLNVAAVPGSKSRTSTTTDSITSADHNGIIFLNNATGYVTTLPAPIAGFHCTVISITANTSGNHTIVTNASANIIKGNQNSVAGDAGDSGTADDTISFVANQSVAGDKVELFSDGTSWFAYAISRVAAGITFTQAS